MSDARERTVHLPERYREQIEASYAEAHLLRTAPQPDSGISAGAAELEQS